MSQATRYARAFQSHRGALIDLYGQLPEEQGGFAAWDEGMSFVRLADHLSASVNRIPAMLQGQKPDAPGAPSTGLTDARARLQSTQDAFVSTVLALSDDDLQRSIPAFGGREMPVWMLLEFITQHEAHHKGQAWMMARMVGVTPPMFVKM
ncbi:DinB family protein [Deinococcus koreensis]|uniref:DinB family protein n=1 Tax=Deinococcus koreensis TaxID=2054903 RepID=A0A2K3UVZ3_9DEIO|nr:DinB family protein [Deinococcus koreensis]PNY80701.1 DinB family protein [Deinococcus koreensis]